MILTVSRVPSLTDAVGVSSPRFVLDRLALGAHVGDHRAHLAHPHAVGDLDLDLVVIDHLGDLADQTAGW